MIVDLSAEVERLRERVGAAEALLNKQAVLLSELAPHLDAGGKALLVRRGRCPVCGYSCRIRVDGTIGAHRLYVSWHGFGIDTRACSGAGQPPEAVA